MPITPYLRGAVFDPEAIKAMAQAFDSAWRVVQSSNLGVTKKRIAEKIVDAASAGERDPDRIRDLALRDFGIHR